MARSILYDFTPYELQILLNTSNSYSDLLIKVGLNPKGGNPDTLKKIIKEYNLDETQLNINRKNFYRQCANRTHEKTKIPLINVFNGNAKMNPSKLL